MSTSHDANLEPCVTDLDCAANEMCFVNTTYFRHTHLNFTDGNDGTGNGASEPGSRPGCACNTFYAWTGPNCTTLSGESFFFLCCYLICVFINLGAIIVSVIALASTPRSSLCGENEYHNRRPNDTNSGWKRWRVNVCARLFSIRNLSARTSTSVFCLCAAIGAGAWAMVLCTSLVATSGPFIGEDWYLERDPYKGRHNVIGYFGGAGGGLFGGAASFNVSLLWLEIAEKIGNLNSQHIKINQLRRYRCVIYMFIVVGAIVLVSSQIYERGNGTTHANILGFTLAPFVWGIMACFIYGAAKFNKVLYETQKRTTVRSGKDGTTQNNPWLTNAFDRAWQEANGEIFSSESEYHLSNLKRRTPNATAGGTLSNTNSSIDDDHGTLLLSQFEINVEDETSPRKLGADDTNNDKSRSNFTQSYKEPEPKLSATTKGTMTGSSPKGNSIDRISNETAPESVTNEPGANIDLHPPPPNTQILTVEPSGESVSLTVPTPKANSDDDVHGTVLLPTSSIRPRADFCRWFCCMACCGMSPRFNTHLSSLGRSSKNYNQNNNNNAATEYVYLLHPALRRAAVAVRNTALQASLALALFSITQFIFSTYDTIYTARLGGNGWRENVNPGTVFPFIKVVYMLEVFGETAVIAIVAKYIHIDSEAAHRS